MARFNKDGTLDAGFGNKGRVTTRIGPSSSALAAALQPDGKIVVAGTTAKNPFGAGLDFALARYKPNGSLDKGFGQSGEVTTSPGPRFNVANGVAIQPDGRIVAVGQSWNEQDTYFDLTRYQKNGSLDPTFGGAGTVLTNLGPGSIATAIRVQGDGRLLVSGSANGGFAVVRYNADGSLDPSFGSGGSTTTTFAEGPAFPYGVALQPDQKSVVAGAVETSEGDDFALARYKSDGTLDQSFGVGGKVTTDLGSRRDRATALAVQPDGKIVVVGSRGTLGKRDYCAVVRYTRSGALDKQFGNAGKVTTAIGSSFDYAETLALQPDGKVVVGGYSYQSQRRHYAFAVVRYLNNQPACVVPNVSRTSLGEARRVISAAHCAMGAVRRAFSNLVKKGRVIAQHPKPGVRRPNQSRVSLVVSKGPRRSH